MPIMTPRGDAHEKINTNQRTFVKSSGNTLTREMPKELEAAPLWITIAITMLKVSLNSVHKPKARPSNMAWTDRAIISMKGVMLQEQQPFLSSLTSN